jgi:hypothetical protein
VRFNSMESQIVRGLGGTDSVGAFLLVVGGLLAVGGLLMAFALTPNAASSAKPEVVNKPNIITTKIDELERLAELKERGLLSDEEFQKQKREILG